MYQEMLEAIEKKLGTAPRKFNFLDKLTWFKQDMPGWNWQNDDIKHSVLNWGKVFKEGKLSWGQVIQVNPLLFDESDINVPGEILIWLENEIKFEPDELWSVADSLFQLKGNSSTIEDAEEKEFAEYLENEYIRVYGKKVPNGLSDDLNLCVSTVFFQRRHLLGKKISNSYFPILYLESHPMVAVVVPYKFWPKDLLELWK